ncbi:MAG TPA: exopolyphosphatase [Methylophilaceae bacterium]|nr:exopolyphosphatase [Methylophilaceae bacterium]
MRNGTLLAAIDLGSNSFRLEIGRYEHGQVQRIEYLKETVRQGNALDERRNLSPEAMQRGWECLSRFSERLQQIKKIHIRAVATQTLREARNREVFLARSREILGLPVEVISGNEEARLIYLGVASLLPASEERRLVIDIGGRSTELIQGTDLKPRHTASFPLGSVGWSMNFFPDGKLSEKAFYQAEVAAQAVLGEACNHFNNGQWDIAYGTSGTVSAVADILQAADMPADRISMKGMQWLRKELIAAGSTAKVELAGLKEDRRPVIGGGVSILMALMELLQIDTLEVAQGALRHGVLAEMVKRSARRSDIRDVSVRRLARKFVMDVEQSQRVKRIALQIMGKLVDSDDKDLTGLLKRELGWAAQLHEIGFAISHDDYHKHGAYILDNADLPGFHVQELHRLSTLVLGQQGKLKNLDVDFDEDYFAALLASLRLAVILCHARRDPDISTLRFSSDADQRLLSVSLPTEWARGYPQSAHLLRQEALAWQKTSWAFELTET